MYSGSCQMAHVDILASLSWGRTAKLVLEALASARAGEGPILVAGAPGLARVLAARGQSVLVFLTALVGGKGHGGRALRGRLDLLPVDDRALAGIVVRSDEPRGDVEWRRVVRPGGAVILVAGGPAVEQSRRALCAGLVDVEQRRAGRLIVTSGRISGH